MTSRRWWGESVEGLAVELGAVSDHRLLGRTLGVVAEIIRQPGEYACDGPHLLGSHLTGDRRVGQVREPSEMAGFVDQAVGFASGVAQVVGEPAGGGDAEFVGGGVASFDLSEQTDRIRVGPAGRDEGVGGGTHQVGVRGEVKVRIGGIEHGVNAGDDFAGCRTVPYLHDTNARRHLRQFRVGLDRS